MTHHILNENVNDFLNNLETYLPELLPIHSNLLKEMQCIVLNANEDIYLETYARLLIQEHYNLDKLTLTKHDDFTSSLYHFEFNYDNKTLDTIKNIIRNQSISGRKYIMILKNFTSNNKQHQLRSLIDSSNTVFIILTKTIGFLSEGIKSRAVLLRLAFKSSKIKEFVKQHYDLDVTDVNKSLISIIAETKTPKYEKELEKLLDIITKSRSQIDTAMAIKDYCYKIFHVCIPLSHICKLIINKYDKHPKVFDIVKVCAESDRNMAISTRDLLCYENLFVSLWQVLRNK
jgi:hypothetical protein